MRCIGPYSEQFKHIGVIIAALQSVYLLYYSRAVLYHSYYRTDYPSSLTETRKVINKSQINRQHNMLSHHPSLAIATRLHLGHASYPPPTQQLTSTLTNFAKLASDVHANTAIVAVDAEERIDGYNLISEVESLCQQINDDESRSDDECHLHILPVQPWGKFVPALNAIVAQSVRNDAQCLLLASAEVSIVGDVMETMWKEMILDDTLVVGKFRRRCRVEFISQSKE